MKQAVLACVALVGLGGGAAWAQAAPVGRAGATAPTEASAAPMAAVREVVTLKTTLFSHDAKEGQVIRAEVRKAGILPGGQTIARGTGLRGTVVHVSKHTKALPNGVVVVLFDHLSAKGKPDLPVIARIVGVDPEGMAASVEEMTRADREAKAKADAEARKKSAMTTGMRGVYLQLSREGETLFALSDDVDLEPGTELTVLLAPGVAK